MTVGVVLRLYACAILFGVWAAVRAAGVHSAFSSVVFLTLAAVSFVVAERQRTRLRGRMRD